MMEYVYGDFHHTDLQKMMKLNPEIESPDRIEVGIEVIFPVSNSSKYGWNDDSVFLLLNKNNTFSGAYDYALEQKDVDVRIFPLWSSDNGFEFLVVLDRPFESMSAAKQFIQHLPSEYTAICTDLKTGNAGRELL